MFLLKLCSVVEPVQQTHLKFYFESALIWEIFPQLLYIVFKVIRWHWQPKATLNVVLHGIMDKCVLTLNKQQKNDIYIISFSEWWVMTKIIAKTKTRSTSQPPTCLRCYKLISEMIWAVHGLCSWFHQPLPVQDDFFVDVYELQSQRCLRLQSRAFVLPCCGWQYMPHFDQHPHWNKNGNQWVLLRQAVILC